MLNLSFDSHFKDLFENTNDLIYFLTLEGKIQFVNPAWQATLNYKQEEVEGRSIYDFIHAPCIEEYKAVREEAISGKGRADLITTFMTRDGNEVIIDGHISCAFDGGKPVYTRGVFKNITARKIAEKKLEDSERRLKTFFRSGPDAVIVINQQQQILEWNPKAESVFGFTADEVVGTLLSETIIPPQYREAHAKGMLHFLKTGQGPVIGKTIEITALHKKGHEFYINLSISNVMVEGEWLFIAFLSDITERKKTEEELIHKEAELLKAKLMEEKKDEFISIASHEMKTPVTTAKAYLQMLQMHLDESHGEASVFAKKANDSVDRLHYLIAELLDVSKIQHGKLNYNLGNFNFNELIDKTVEDLQYTSPNHTIVKTGSIQQEINGDKDRLQQVVVNLLSNAIKYSPDRKEVYINIEEKTACLPHRQSEIKVAIKDQGIGMSKHHLEKIFERYYRVEEHAIQFQGLGIGLFISYEIIQRHNGKLWVESEPGKGSIFYFTLPFSQP